MTGTGKRKKTKKKKGKAGNAAEAQPRRSKLTPDERRRVEDMHEILGEVWEPFKTAAGAVRGLEADSSPWLELEFWDSLAEAFVRYFGKAITLQVDTAGLLRDQKAAAAESSPIPSLQRTRNADAAVGEGRVGTEEASNAAEDEGSPVSMAHSVDAAFTAESGEEGRQGDGDGDGDDGGQAGAGEVVEEAVSLDAGAAGLEMLPMGAVGHLTRRDRVGIIRKTVPKEKRIAVLQRLFHLAQAPAVEVEMLVASVKELKDNSSSAEIRDVNLLQTWQGVREERDAAWEHATEQVRLAAEAASSESAASVESPEVVQGGNAAAGPGDVLVDVEGGGDS